MKLEPQLCEELMALRNEVFGDSHNFYTYLEQFNAHKSLKIIVSAVMMSLMSLDEPRTSPLRPVASAQVLTTLQKTTSRKSLSRSPNKYRHS